MSEVLDDERVESLGREFDRIRAEVVADLGDADARYIRRIIALQRALEVSGRGLLLISVLPPAWLAGTAALATAKILENMEIGHNVLHGQWDWMGDPKICSATWEWDNATPAEQWKHSHNYVHHTWTNVLGKDRDIGYSLLRIHPEQPWKPVHLGQPIYNLILAVLFEHGIAVYDAELERAWRGEKSWREVRTQLGRTWAKVRRQAVKDYLAFPALAGPSFLPCLLGNLSANVVRNVWAHTVIFCGHFPDGVAVFPPEQLEDESRGQWYVRQLTGSANISGGPLLHLLTGNLSHQIEHHLFPDLPSNRYSQIAAQVRPLCARYGLPYRTGSLIRQTASVWRKVLRFALPGGSADAVPDEAGRLGGLAPSGGDTVVLPALMPAQAAVRLGHVISPSSGPLVQP